MDLRKLINKFYDLPLFLVLIYYFNNIKKRSRLEKAIYILLILALFLNIILSFNLVKARFVTWNYFFLTG